tara:strand:- start:596 stop:817 length:222 start_codon:yes stop_codon:yes gene_type:complete
MPVNIKTEIDKCDKCGDEYDSSKSQGWAKMENCVYETLPDRGDGFTRQKLISYDWGHYCNSCFNHPLASLYRW